MIEFNQTRKIKTSRDPPRSQVPMPAPLIMAPLFWTLPPSQHLARRSTDGEIQGRNPPRADLPKNVFVLNVFNMSLRCCVLCEFPLLEMTGKFAQLRGFYASPCHPSPLSERNITHSTWQTQQESFTSLRHPIRRRIQKDLCETRIPCKNPLINWLIIIFSEKHRAFGPSFFGQTAPSKQPIQAQHYPLHLR